MPNIRVADTPALGLRPTEIGVEATAAAARRGGAFFNQAAQDYQTLGHEAGSALKAAGDVAVDYVAHREISQGAANFANKTAELTDLWNSAAKNANPNDPTVAANFNEKVLNPALEKFRDGFMTEKGQQWAEGHIDALRQHMYQKTTADMATLAGEAVKTNVRTMTNAWGNTAYKDPSSVQFLLDNADSSIKGVIDSNPNLKGTAAAQVSTEVLQKTKEQIVKAGYYGAISKAADPEKVAAEWSSRFPDYVTPEEVNQFAHAAKAQNKANALTDRQLQTYARQESERQADGALSKNFTDSVTFDENGHAMIKPDFYKNVMEIERQFPGARTGRAEAMIKWAQSETRERREVVVTDKPTQSALYDGLFRTDKPTTDVDILRAAAEKKIDAHDTSTLLGLYKALEEKPLRGPIYQGTMEAVKGVYGTGEKGHEAYAKFLQTFLPDYLKKQRDGSLPPNALDIRDENSMISQAMKPFRLTASEKMMDTINKRIGMGGGDVTINLTGDGKTVTGMSIENKFAPPPTWQYSDSRKQYRDPKTGKVYDLNGVEVK